ncbi:peptidase [Phenylobacterium deserti]|uniref:Peptidase n=1 Tax=Phenylobacterium deserti TaxID=1914756 RepID=A0A328AVG5_9CAUL|nr:peptidase [Phenylobacterium deserti]RAK57554.1 peptidase [Phenylobacterium deserti]
MTYCVGLLVKDGLVMLADTRTNAGVDNISTYRKLQIFGNDGERLVAVATAGSLSTTQAALEQAAHGFLAPDTGEMESIHTAPTIHRAAWLIGQAVRQARTAMEGLTQGSDINFDATLLVGGSIGGEPTRLFLVYGAGNFIECGPDTPYLQIGETKYGKPILDRALTFDTDVYEAVKIGLISFSSTMRSNLAVGLPIDLLIARSGQATAELVHRIDETDPYYHDLNERWSTALRAAQASIPQPPYRAGAI